MEHKLQYHLVLTSWMSCFFQDFPAWLRRGSALADAGLAAGCRGLGEAPSAALSGEYDDLFKGTHAAIYLPLWSSCCLGEGDPLLDASTLEVIGLYKSWGYRPLPMDGNPPDYIGQLLRFAEYLLALALAAQQAGGDPQPALSALERFQAAFLTKTARMVADGIRAHTRTPVFLHAAALLESCARLEGTPPSLPVPSPALLEDTLYPCILENGAGPPEMLRPAKVINTAGRNNCGGKCVIRAVEQEGCVLRMDTDDSGSIPPLRACARGRSYHRTYLTGHRLRYPMKRVGARGEGRFRRISWEEAADEIAREWIRIRDAYGPAARYVNYSTGVSAVLRPDHLVERLLNLDGGFLGGYNSYSSACSRYITPYIYGDSLSGNSMEDILHTRFLLLWGHNPAETVFGTERGYYLKKLRERGVRIVVVDPRCSDTVRSLASQWVGIRPSTDGALADAMAYVIWSEGLQDQRFMDTYCLGFDEAHMPQGAAPHQSYHDYLFGLQDGIRKTPAWASAITGIPAETICALAREYATAKPACLLPGLGVQRTGNGEQSVRALAMLACLTGNVGVSGGGAAGAGAVPGHRTPRFPTGRPAFPGKIPVFLWTAAVDGAERMTARDDGLKGVEQLPCSVKMLWNLAGNTLVNQHADINATVKLLRDTRKCELIVCSDVFMTASARFADILLPAPSFLEGENIAAPWEYGDYLLFNNQVTAPLFDCRFEYGLIGMVAQRLGLWEEWSGGHRAYAGWLRTLYDDLRACEPELPAFEQFRAQGAHRYAPREPFIAYAPQIRDPENHPFATASGKIEIYSPAIAALGRPGEAPPIPRYVACPEGPSDPLRARYPLQLIGYHTKRRCHSIHDGNPALEKLDPQRAWMHPEDAAARGIADGALVEVRNGRGATRLPAFVTDRIVQGVVAIAQGAWYAPDSRGTDRGGSINVLTSMRPTPIARGNAQHTSLVEVCPLDGAEGAAQIIQRSDPRA